MSVFCGRAAPLSPPGGGAAAPQQQLTCRFKSRRLRVPRFDDQRESSLKQIRESINDQIHQMSNGCTCVFLFRPAGHISLVQSF